MQQITAPEILWRIFTLVESNADLARAGRLNKFIGAIALDVLWTDINFKSFLSLFPTQTTRVRIVPHVTQFGWLNCTNIVIPLLPKHWERVNIYARRVRTLRRGCWIRRGMEQILTSLKLYGHGSEYPYIFPRLKRLIWDCPTHGEIKELSLIATLFFTPTLQELSIRIHEYQDEHDPPPPESTLPYGLSLLVPLNVISESNFSALKRLYLPLPALSTKSLERYHPAVINLLLNLPKWQLEEISLILTKDILHILSTFPNLRSLEMYELPTNPFDSRTSEHSKDTTGFDNLRSLIVHNLNSASSMGHLNFFQCAPSHHIKVYYNHEVGSDTFHEIIRLLRQRKDTLESLQVHGTMDLTTFSEWLFTLPNLKELRLDPDITLNIQDDTLRLISTEWRDITFLSISHEDEGANYITVYGAVGPNDCRIKSFDLCFTFPQMNIEEEEIVDLTILSEWLLTFPNLEELSLGPGVALNISDYMLRRMSAKWSNLTHLSISHNKADLVSLSGIASLSRCPIETLRLSSILTQKDIDDLQQQINNSENSPLYSLRKFDMVDLVNGFGMNVTGAAFVLTWLFPNVELELPQDSAHGQTFDRHVQEALRVRTVVLRMMNTRDTMASIIQVLAKDK